jgi:hypothetical protein
MRTGDEAWTSTSLAGMLPTGESMDLMGHRQLAPYLTNLAVTDAGSAYVVRGNLDLTPLMQQHLDGMSFFSGMGSMGMPSRGATNTSPLDVDLNIDVQLVIDKRTMYTTAMEMSMTAPPTERGMMSGFDMSFRITFSDFDDPSIVIQAPKDPLGVTMWKASRADDD